MLVMETAWKSGNCEFKSCAYAHGFVTLTAKTF